MGAGSSVELFISGPEFDRREVLQGFGVNAAGTSRVYKLCYPRIPARQVSQCYGLKNELLIVLFDMTLVTLLPSGAEADPWVVPNDVWWFMQTPAEIQIAGDGTSARLSQSSTHLEARILSPPQARFTVMDAEPLPTSPHPGKQANNNGVRKLVIHLKDVTDLRLAVLFVPLPDGKATTKNAREIVALKEW